MQITATGIKPCSKCYKARMKAKALSRRALGLPSYPYTVVVYPSGLTVVVDNATHLVHRTLLNGQDHSDNSVPVGLMVYVAGKWLIDVAKADHVAGLPKFESATDLDDLRRLVTVPVSET